MKRIFPLTIGLLLSITIFGQAPHLFNYQGIVRQASGNPVANKKISLRISIIDGSATGKTVYSEIQQATTNSSGLYSIAIGSGKTLSGAMKDISWGSRDKFIHVEIDTDGGDRYTSIGTAQLLSVPFALYAANGPGTSSKESLAGTYWETTGNSGTTPGTNFLGTTDNVGLVFKTNNEMSGFLDPTRNNVALGTHALFNNGGSNMVAIGDSALYSQQSMHGAYYNTAVGSKSLFANTIGTMNTGIGYRSLASNNTGTSNTAAGSTALQSNTVGYDNTAHGAEALRSNTSGGFNTAIGVRTLYNNEEAYYNTAVGAGSMFHNTSGYFNSATGMFSLRSNTSGWYNTSNGAYNLYSNTSGEENTASGFQALFSNTIGSRNVAAGSSAMFSNTTGSSNTSIGTQSLYSNNSGINNVGVGYLSLFTNTVGVNNTATGVNALYSNSTGNYNVAGGEQALYYNSTGTSNTAHGSSAAYYNSTGNYNTALGAVALISNTTGGGNTCLGAIANTGNSNLTNATAIGYMASVDASNKVRVGNSSVTSIGGQVGWTTFSDGRYKTNVQENIAGLDFILRLRPVSYIIDQDKLDEKNYSIIPDSLRRDAVALSKNDNRYTGFIAQEVEAAAKQSGFDFSGVDKPGNENALYGLRYAEFVVPLVKAVQEQQIIIESLKKEIAALKAAKK